MFRLQNEKQIEAALLKLRVTRLRLWVKSFRNEYRSQAVVSRFEVQGSRKNWYEIAVIEAEGEIIVSCGCAAASKPEIVCYHGVAAVGIFLILAQATEDLSAAPDKKFKT